MVESSRGRWALARVAVLLLAVAVLSPVSPFLLVSVPLAVLLLAFRSGRLSSALLAAGLAWLAFTPTAGSMTPLWYGERAWALVTAGAFVGATLLWPQARLALRSIAAVASGFFLTIFLSWTIESPGDWVERLIPLSFALLLSWLGSRSE